MNFSKNTIIIIKKDIKGAVWTFKANFLNFSQSLGLLFAQINFIIYDAFFLNKPMANGQISVKTNSIV
jgi:hypothetical protein